jgi:hypothetical protein
MIGAGENAVTTWFGESFGSLHPRLQALHRGNGKLRGPVTFWFGQGVAGAFGRRLARHLGIPDTAGEHELDVDIGHDGTTMWWNRRFDQSHALRSSFRPVGAWPDGHWIENTDPMQFTLTVAVVEGGWYWRIVGARLRGVPLPLWLTPRVTAYKRIEDDKYRFHVGFALPIIGAVMSYSGLLELNTNG